MKPKRLQDLDRVLESAMVVSWRDLIHGMQNGLVHIEYGFSPSGTLDDLQVWSSTRRGYWLLACSYRMATSHGPSPVGIVLVTLHIRVSIIEMSLKDRLRHKALCRQA